MLTGSRVVYARSVAQLGDDMQRVRPTVMIAVPRVFERVYARVREQWTNGRRPPAGCTGSR